MSGQRTQTRVPDIMVIDYAHDRRKHRHRCQGCCSIVNAGERVYMARVANKKTRVVHVEGCANLLSGELTVLQLMGAHAYGFLNPTHTGEQSVAWSRLALSQPETVKPKPEDCDHSWEKFEYEPDTNFGGYKECTQCGHTEPITPDDYEDYEYPDPVTP